MILKGRKPKCFFSFQRGLALETHSLVGWGDSFFYLLFPSVQQKSHFGLGILYCQPDWVNWRELALSIRLSLFGEAGSMTTSFVI